MSISQPLLALRSQSRKDGSHFAIEQLWLLADPPQLAAATCAVMQLMPQPWQLSAVPGWVSQLLPSLSQSAQSSAHFCTRQLPLAQVAACVFAIAQPLPHAPQSTSVVSAVSQPSR